MKSLRMIIGILFFSLILFGLTSCMIRTYSNEGRHRERGHKKERNEHKSDDVIIIKEEHHDHRSDDHHKH